MAKLLIGVKVAVQGLGMVGAVVLGGVVAGVAVTAAGMDVVSTARSRLADDGVAGSGLGAATAGSMRDVVANGAGSRVLEAAACSRRVAVARLGRRGRGAGARSRPRSPGFGRLTSSLPCRGGSSWRRRWSSRSQHGGAAWGAEEKGKGSGAMGRRGERRLQRFYKRVLGLRGGSVHPRRPCREAWSPDSERRWRLRSGMGRGALGFQGRGSWARRPAGPCVVGRGMAPVGPGDEVVAGWA